MAVNQDQMMQTFITIARDAVGSSLSLIGQAGSQFPAVIKARQNGPKPDYPYIVLDFIESKVTSGWKLFEGVNADGYTTYSTTYNYMLTYTVYGGNATSIAHELEGYFRVPSVLATIEDETGGKLGETFAVETSPVLLATEQLEVASFPFTYNVLDTYVDTGAGTIKRIVNDGTLISNGEELPVIHIEVTSIPQMGYTWETQVYDWFVQSSQPFYQGNYPHSPAL